MFDASDDVGDGSGLSDDARTAFVFAAVGVDHGGRGAVAAARRRADHAAAHAVGRRRRAGVRAVSQDDDNHGGNRLKQVVRVAGEDSFAGLGFVRLSRNWGFYNLHCFSSVTNPGV